MLSDPEIQDLIEDVKPLSSTILKEIQLENKKYHILRRYNGKHIHKNQIEKDKFRDFHIHKATQRYIDAGFRIDGYAQVTDSYNNWKDALTKMLKDCNFKGDMSLFNSFN